MIGSEQVLPLLNWLRHRYGVPKRSASRRVMVPQLVPLSDRILLTDALVTPVYERRVYDFACAVDKDGEPMLSARADKYRAANDLTGSGKQRLPSAASENDIHSLRGDTELRPLL